MKLFAITNKIYGKFCPFFKATVCIAINVLFTDERIKILRVTDYTATSDVPIGNGYYAVSNAPFTL